jgi:hypothetical protein
VISCGGKHEMDKQEFMKFKIIVVKIVKFLRRFGLMGSKFVSLGGVEAIKDDISL